MIAALLAAVAVIALGAWLRWSARSVAVAFRLGRIIGRMR